MIIEAYDVGGTWTRAAIIEDGQIKTKTRETTEKDFIKQIERLSHQLKTYNAKKKVILLPGPVQEGVLLSAPPLGIQRPRDLKRELGDVVIENDLTAAVYAELHRGYGREWNNFYLLSLSTGIGAGIVIDNKVRRGGEFGHCRIDRELELQCICGRTKCWCAYASGSGIITLRERVKDETERKEMLRDANAQGLAYMINALEVEGIVIMGSVGRHMFRTVIPRKEHIRRYTINPVPKIVKTTLGDDIGLLGAYYLAEEAA